MLNIFVLNALLMLYVASGLQSAMMRVRKPHGLYMAVKPSGRLRKLPSLPIHEEISKNDVLDEEDRAKRCLKYLDDSPDPFHVVKSSIRMLEANGFKGISESELWRKNKTLKRGGKYYFTRNGSTIVAFIVGKKYKSGNGFKVLGAHTDSPNLKLKPRSKKSGHGLIQLSVETYGGGLWHTWFDRDLSIAGRVILRDHKTNKFTTKLICINDRSILRVPNLCIHLRTPEERESFKVNKEDHLIPILCDEINKALGSSNSTDVTKDLWLNEQSPELISLLNKELEVDTRKQSIVDFELSLFDVQKAAITGMRNEFLCSSRIDNLVSCFATLDALVDHSNSNIQDDEGVSMVALFDHEEVGSESNAGAGSTVMQDAITRISNALLDDNVEDTELFKCALTKSMILSVDMAHAIHPNYASKHEKGHAPKLNTGIVIKTNNNQVRSLITHSLTN